MRRAQAERKEGRSGNKPPRPSLNADTLCSPFSSDYSTEILIFSPQCGQMMYASFSLGVCFSESVKTNSLTLHPIAFAIFSIVDNRMSFFSLNRRETETRLIPRRSANSIWVIPYFSNVSLNLIIYIFNTLHLKSDAKIILSF